MINFKNQAEENTNTTGTEESIGKAEIFYVALSGSYFLNGDNLS